MVPTGPQPHQKIALSSPLEDIPQQLKDNILRPAIKFLQLFDRLLLEYIV
jgi:hypothetical protein